jgi:hypothetical protein
MGKQIIYICDFCVKKNKDNYIEIEDDEGLLIICNNCINKVVRYAYSDVSLKDLRIFNDNC